MAKANTNERLDAALAWASLDEHERNVRSYRARKPAIQSDPAKTIAKYFTGPTTPVRMNRRLVALAAYAWPDANTRKTEISKLIVIAAFDVIKKRLESVPAK